MHADEDSSQLDVWSRLKKQKDDSDVGEKRKSLTECLILDLRKEIRKEKQEVGRGEEKQKWERDFWTRGKDQDRDNEKKRKWWDARKEVS